MGREIHARLPDALAELQAGWEAFLELKRAADLAQDPGSRAVAQAAEQGFNAGGGAGMLQSILSTQEELHKNGLLPSYSLAETSALAGRNSEAIRYLNAASEESFSSFVV